jgi:hypothetical protein
MLPATLIAIPLLLIWALTLVDILRRSRVRRSPPTGRPRSTPWATSPSSPSAGVTGPRSKS